MAGDNAIVPLDLETQCPYMGTVGTNSFFKNFILWLTCQWKSILWLACGNQFDSNKVYKHYTFQKSLSSFYYVQPHVHAHGNCMLLHLFVTFVWYQRQDKPWDPESASSTVLSLQTCCVPLLKSPYCLTGCKTPSYLFTYHYWNTTLTITRIH